MNFTFESNDEYLRLLMISTTLRGTYDTWIDNPQFSDVLNVETNSTCIKLKKLFPTTDNKVVQSISLAVLVYMYIIFCSTINFNDSNLLEDDLELD